MRLTTYLLIVFLLFSSVFSWQIVPNYRNYTNVTDINFTAPLGYAKYFYVPGNALPNFNTSQFLQESTILAYNSKGQYLQALPYYVYNGGLLVNGTTTNGTLSFATVYYNTLRFNVSRMYKKVSSYTSSIPYTVTLIDFGANVTLNKTVLDYPTTTNLAGYLSLDFNVTQPYFLRSFFSFGYTNYTLNYCERPVFNFCGNKYSLSVINPVVHNTASWTNSVLSGYTSSITASVSNMLNANTSVTTYIQDNGSSAAYSYLLHTNTGLGIYTSNSDIFNSTETLGNGGVFYSSTPYNLDLYFPNASVVQNTYDLVPAYTTNIIVSSNSISKPIPLPNVTTNNLCIKGWFCEPYAIQVNNVSFKYIFQTKAYPGNQGKETDLNYSHVGFAVVNITHYAEMGTSCSNLYLDAYNFTSNLDYGKINYSVLSCGSQIQLLIPNLTASGNLYSQFNVYFGGLQSSTYTKNVFNSWEFENATTSSFTPSTTSLIKLPKGLNKTGFHISFGDPSYAYSTYAYLYACGGQNSSTRALYFFVAYSGAGGGCYYSGPNGPTLSSNNTLTYLYSPSFGVATGTIYASGDRFYNTTSVVGSTYNYGFQPTPIYVYGGNVSAYYLAAYPSISQKVLTNPGTSSKTSSLPSVPSNLDNTTIDFNVTNSTFTDFGINSTLNAKGLNKNVLFMGINVPVSEVLIVVLCLLLCIVAVLEDELPLVFGVIFLLIGAIVNVSVEIVGVIIVFVWLGFRASEFFKESGKNG